MTREQMQRLIWRLDYLIFVTTKINRKEDLELAELDDLRAQVEETKGVELSAIALITGLAARLEEAIAAGNPAVLVALKDDLHASATQLADAVAANS